MLLRYVNIWQKRANERKVNPEIEEYEHKMFAFTSVRSSLSTAVFARARKLATLSLECYPPPTPLRLRSLNPQWLLFRSGLWTIFRENRKSRTDYWHHSYSATAVGQYAMHAKHSYDRILSSVIVASCCYDAR